MVSQSTLLHFSVPLFLLYKRALLLPMTILTKPFYPDSTWSKLLYILKSTYNAPFLIGMVWNLYATDRSRLEYPSSTGRGWLWWRPPEPGFVKINTDAAIKCEDGKGGARGVARSPDSFLGAWSKPFPGVTDPLIAEAMAVWEGVIFANLRGFSNVVLETDCLEVVNLWNTRHDSWSVVAPILVEIGELAGSLNYFYIHHVVRSANGPVHICAKHACTIDGTESWLDNTPSFLISSLLADSSANSFV